MLLHNLNQSGGLCNGTHLTVRTMGNVVIEAQIITGTHACHIVFVPRICLTLKKSQTAFYT